MSLRRWLRDGAAILILIGIVAASAIQIGAQASPAQAFLESIYQNYRGKDAKGILLDRPATVRRYFVPALAGAMIEDQAEAARRGAVPALDGDPFVDAQDWDIADLTVRMVLDGKATAVAVVSFRNFGEPRSVTLELAMTPAGWRIADIRMAKHSLRELYPAR